MNISFYVLQHMDSINKKISSDLVIVEIKKNAVYKTQKESVKEIRTASVIEAIICCPLCSQQITVLYESTKTNKFLWNTSNFDWHLENVHLNQGDNLENNDVQEKDEITRKRVVEESLRKINNEVNLTITTEAKILMSEKSINQSDDIEINNLEEVKIPRSVADKKPLKKISIHDSNSTITSEVGEIKADYMEAKFLELNKSTEKTDSTLPLRTSEPTEVFIQKQTGCRENHDVSSNGKSQPSIVCYSDTSVEDEEQQHEQLQSEIVNAGILKFELNKNFETSQQIAKSTYPVGYLHSEY